MFSEVRDPVLERVIDAMPGWPEAEHVEAHYISGGITNRNYCVRVGGSLFFVRLAGEETEALGIDRDNERLTVEEASRVGVGPRVVAYLRTQGCLVTEWIEGDPIPAESLREKDMLALLVRSLKAFHDDVPEIPGSFSPFRVVEQYRRFVEGRGMTVPDAYQGLSERAGEIEEAFGRSPAPLRPCHNDLLNANFLLCEGEVKVVDYEYAGMGDVFFDLGNLSVNHEFDDTADRMLLDLYFGEITPVRIARLKLMKVMSDFREAMWGVMQQVLSDLDFDYVDYADRHFERCREQAEDGRYRQWLRDAAGEV